jgi:signal transduction histidine kinase
VHLIAHSRARPDPGAGRLRRPLDDRDMRRVAQIIVLARIAVVVSIAALVVFGAGRYSAHLVLVSLVLGVAFVYALALLGHEQVEMRYRRTAWLITAMDSALALLLLWLTGGIGSPTVAVLVLVVVVAALRHSPGGTLITAGLLAAILGSTALLAKRSEVVFDVSVLGLWWPAYFLITAVLTTALSALVEREHESRLRASLEAEEEHAAAEEERDLRQRLLRAYQSQQDGLRVILHEFRTPVFSLGALTAALTDTDQPLSPADAAATARLAREHIRHLDEMLEALGDVAVSWRPAFTSGRVRDVDLLELAKTAAHAAGVATDRLQFQLRGQDRVVRLDAQALRRILTNLIENAGRHSGTRPVEVELHCDTAHVVVAVRDRGPGVPTAAHGELSRMYTSVGDKHGTAGLGLWIVQQIVDASGGELIFENRDGGGLVVTVKIPLAPPALQA